MKKSLLERYAYQLILKEAKSEVNELYLLDEAESHKLKQLKVKTYLKAGLAGAIGVLLLYLPYHFFGSALFPVSKFYLAWFDFTLELELEFLIYSVVLVVIEIIYLTRLNIHTVAKTMAICGSYSKKDPFFNENVDALIAVGLEKKQNQLKSIGINPYDGLSRWAVFVYQVMLKLKAALSGFVLKLVLTKILGRYVLRVVIDIAGVPLYAFWNIWGVRFILNEARVRILAPPLINLFAEKLHDEFKYDVVFKSIIYDVLQAIATRKRAFHYNHFLLAVSILKKFEIEPSVEPRLDRNFLHKAQQYDEKVEEAISKLLIFGIIIDGNLSNRELRTIKEMRESGVIDFTDDQIKKWSLDFFEGRGLSELINY